MIIKKTIIMITITITTIMITIIKIINNNKSTKSDPDTSTWNECGSGLSSVEVQRG